MDKDKIIIANKDIDVTDLNGEKVMMNMDQGKYFMIKGVGNRIWDILKEEKSYNQVVEILLNEYEVDRDTCEKSVTEFVDKLFNAGLAQLQ